MSWQAVGLNGAPYQHHISASFHVRRVSESYFRADWKGIKPRSEEVDGNRFLIKNKIIFYDKNQSQSSRQKRLGYYMKGYYPDVRMLFFLLGPLEYYQADYFFYPCSNCTEAMTLGGHKENNTRGFYTTFTPFVASKYRVKFIFLVCLLFRFGFFLFWCQITRNLTKLINQSIN